MRDGAKKGEGARGGWAGPGPLGENTAETGKREMELITGVS